MMNTNTIKQVAKNLGGVISQNSPTILTGVAVAGFISTVILAVKATPKALQILDEERDDVIDNFVGYGRIKDFNKLDIIRLIWKCYIPTCAVGVASIVCIIGSNSINLRRNAAIASVYTLTEAAFKEYQSKVTETIGRNKELKVRDEISADYIKANPPGTKEIIITGKGDVLCCDSLSGRHFKSNIEQIRRAINDLNREFMSDRFISVNDLYYAIGLSDTKLGDQMGWKLDDGVKVSFSSQLTEDGEPCLVLNYEVIPKFI